MNMLRVIVVDGTCWMNGVLEAYFARASSMQFKGASVVLPKPKRVQLLSTAQFRLPQGQSQYPGRVSDQILCKALD